MSKKTYFIILPFLLTVSLIFLPFVQDARAVDAASSGTVRSIAQSQSVTAAADTLHISQTYVSKNAINVTLYGAFGDGMHDDTMAIQAAIDAASTDNESTSVLVPAGTYNITSINLPSDSHIIAYGATFRLVDAGMHTITLTNVARNFLSPGFMVNGKSNVIIEGATIDGNYNPASPRQYYRCGIVIYDSSNVTLKKLVIHDTEGMAIRTQSSITPDFDYMNPLATVMPCNKILITDCHVYNTHSTYNPSDPNKNILAFVRGYGIEINRADTVTVRNCSVEDGQESLFRSEKSRNVNFINCCGNRTTVYGEPFDIYKSSNVTLNSDHATCSSDSIRSKGFGFTIYENNGVKLLNSTACVNGIAIRIRPTSLTDYTNNIEVSDCEFHGESLIQVNFGHHIKFSNNKIFGVLAASRYQEDQTCMDVQGLEICDNDVSIATTHL